jgi:hypothetical protein
MLIILQELQNIPSCDAIMDEVTGSDTEETAMMSPNTNTPTDVKDTTSGIDMKKKPHCTSSATVSSNMSAPTTGSFKKSLKRKSDNTSGAVHQAITSLKEVAAANNAANDEDEFSEYAMHVAAQLRKLPLVNALRLQEKIQNLITEERISCVTGADNSENNRLVQEALSPQIRSAAYSVSEQHSAFSGVSYSSCESHGLPSIPTLAESLHAKNTEYY